MAILEGQKAKVKWNSANKEWYIKKGYIFTKIKDTLIVDVIDLTPSATNIVEFSCDYCYEKGIITVYHRQWNVQLRSMKTIQKHTCINCSGKKKIESKKILGTVYTDNSRKAHDKFKLSFDNIKSSFESKNYMILTENYLNNKQLLQFVCRIHSDIGVQTTTADRINRIKHNCKACQKEQDIYNIKNSLEELDSLQIYKEVLSGKIKAFPSGFFKYSKSEDIKKILDHFLEISLNSKILTKENIITVLNHEQFEKYKLSSIIQVIGLQSIIRNYFPFIKPWEISGVPPNFWNKEENIKEASSWFYEMLIKDGIINNKNEILKIKNWKRYFRKYKLEGLLNIRFGARIFAFWNYVFPNEFFEWEYAVTTRNYWDKKENVILSLKQLIELRLKLKKEDIPQIITYPFLVENYKKFSTHCDTNYQSNIFRWINDCYPNEFEEKQFKKYIASDGTNVDSWDEKIIHDLLLDNGIQMEYFENKIANSKTFINKEFQESYVPDWIIDNRIIVEYFGWYIEKNYKYDFIKRYIDKANRKIRYFSSLKEYSFIHIYPEDIKDNFKGLIDKFKKHNIIVFNLKQVV